MHFIPLFKFLYDTYSRLRNNNGTLNKSHQQCGTQIEIYPEPVVFVQTYLFHNNKMNVKKVFTLQGQVKK